MVFRQPLESEAHGDHAEQEAYLFEKPVAGFPGGEVEVEHGGDGAMIAERSATMWACLLWTYGRYDRGAISDNGLLAIDPEGRFLGKLGGVLDVEFVFNVLFVGFDGLGTDGELLRNLASG